MAALTDRIILKRGVLPPEGQQGQLPRMAVPGTAEAVTPPGEGGSDVGPRTPPAARH